VPFCMCVCVCVPECICVHVYVHVSIHVPVGVCAYPQKRDPTQLQGQAGCSESTHGSFKDGSVPGCQADTVLQTSGELHHSCRMQDMGRQGNWLPPAWSESIRRADDRCFSVPAHAQTPDRAGCWPCPLNVKEPAQQSATNYKCRKLQVMCKKMSRLREFFYPFTLKLSISDGADL
jgi:hypothetical protein